MNFLPYPPNKTLTPFDLVDGDNYFAAIDKATSYLGSFEEVGDLWHPGDPRNEFFPMSSFVVLILKRHCVVENGMLVYKNLYFEDGHTCKRCYGHTEDKYMIYTNVLHSYWVDSWQGDCPILKTYTIQNDNHTFNGTLGPKFFASQNQAIQYAAQISSQKHMKCVVAQLFNMVDRH